MTFPSYFIAKNEKKVNFPPRGAKKVIKFILRCGQHWPFEFQEWSKTPQLWSFSTKYGDPKRAIKVSQKNDDFRPLNNATQSEHELNPKTLKTD